MAISFDPSKRLWTRQHRGLDFATDAAKVFAGRTVTKIDGRFDYGESATSPPVISARGWS